MSALQQVAPVFKPASEPAPTERYPATLQAGMEELLQLLQDDDLTALERFSPLREALDAVPQSLVLPLEAALQDLDLAQALVSCRAVVAWLSQPESVDQPLLAV